MAKPLDHHVHLLPPVLQEIAGLIGVDRAIALARAYGGRRLYFPETLAPNHKLAQLLGRPAALILCQHYTRLHIEIPSARHYLRWYDVRVYKAQGKSNTEISRITGLTFRHVGTLLDGFDPGSIDSQPAQIAPHMRCPACGRAVTARSHAPTRPSNQLDFGFPAR